MLYYYINYDFAKAKNINGERNWLIVDYLREFINDDEDKIIGFIFVI